MVATRTASLSRCVLRCFGSRFASSALMPSVQTTIPFTCAMARSHVRANTESLHHTSLQPVKPFSRKLMDVELDFSAFEGSWGAFVSERLAYFRLKRTKSIAPVATAAR
jgi:hypothetical protein